MWDHSVADVQIMFETDQLIHLRVTVIQLQKTFELSCIYGLNDYTQRRELWQSLRSISLTMSSTPWTVLGDFNALRKAEDGRGGAQSWPNYMDKFNDCCRDSILDDLQFSGCQLTWRKQGQGTNALVRKLDRALSNHIWLSDFTKSEAIFLEPGASYHSPIVVKTGLPVHIRKPPFRFFNF